MTKKRFTINDCRVLSNEQVFKILNQLTEDNEQLKQENKELKEKNKFILGQLEWEDEHKQLCDETVDELNKLQDEVDSIKHIIREAYLSERTMLGKSVLRQLMENIGEE